MKRKRATRTHAVNSTGVYFVYGDEEYFMPFAEIIQLVNDSASLAIENGRLREDNRKLLRDLDAQIRGDLAARKSLCEQSDRYKDERDAARFTLAKIDKLVDFPGVEDVPTVYLAQLKAALRA